MAGLGDLVVRLSAETAQFTQALDKASYQSQKNFDRMVSSAKTAGVAIAGAFAIGEFANMAKKAMQFADTMQDVATANDVGVESILALSEALTQNGGKSENAGKMLSSLTAKIYEASEGSKTAQEAFRGAGVSINDLSKLSTIELFDKLINKLANTQDAALRNGMAMEFFGKAAKGVDFVGLAQGTDEARQKFLAYAQAIQVSADLNDKLEAKTMKTMVMFNTTFIPTMNAVYDSANKGGSAFESMMVFGGEAFKGLVYGARVLVTGLQTVNASVNLIGLTLADIGSGKFNTFFDRLEEYDKYVGDLRKKDKEFARDLVKNNEDTKKALAGKGDINRTIKTPKEDLAGIASATEANKKYASSMAEMIAKKQLAMQTPLMTEEEKKLQEDMIAIQKAYSDAQATIVKQYTEGKLPIADYEEQLRKLGLTYEQTIMQSQGLSEKQQQLNNSWEYGATIALKKYAEEASNISKSMQGIVNTGIKSLEDGLVGLVQGTVTVKDAFRTMASAIIADLARVAVRQGITAPLASAMGAYFGGGKALGGNVTAGTSYLVGEQGAEIFTPMSNGVITSNKEAGIGSSTNVVVNVNMSEGTTSATSANQLGVMIGNAVKGELIKQKRAGGLLA